MKSNYENRKSKMAPKMMPGTVRTQFVKCGKSNCRCSCGELHGPYHYLVIRINGKRHKRYIKFSEIEEIQKACLARQKEKKTQISASKSMQRKLRQIREQLRNIRDNHILPMKEKYDDRKN